MLTGIYVRIERNHKFLSLDIGELTDAEIDMLFETTNDTKQWAIALARMLRDVI